MLLVQNTSRSNHYMGVTSLNNPSQVTLGKIENSQFDTFQTNVID